VSSAPSQNRRQTKASEPSAARRFTLSFLTELGRSLLILALVALALALLLRSSGDAAPGSWWLDASGQPILSLLRERAGETLSLVALALAISLPLALSLALMVAKQPALAPLSLLANALSGLPVFVLGYALIDWQPPWLTAALVLAIADLSLGGLLKSLQSTLDRELRSDHARGAIAKGASLTRHLWRPVLASLLLSLRTRLPVILAATVVAERIFNIPGLGDQASYAVLELPDPVFLAWFTLLCVALVRLVSVLAKSAEALLIPARSAAGLGSEAPTSNPEDASSLGPAKRAARPKKTPPPAPTAPPGFRARAALDSFLRSFPGAQAPLPLRALGLGLVALAFLGAGALALGAILVDPEKLYGETRNALPSIQHWLGTDDLQRDVLVQIFLGARWAAPWWALAVALPSILGVAAGALATRPRLRPFIELFMESLDALPKLVVVLLLLSAFGVERYLSLGLPVMGLMFAPEVYAQVRTRIEHLIRARFVEAEQVAGATRWRALLLHVLWSNLRGLILIRATQVLGGVVLLDATCGYLQLAQRELCAWGALVYDNVQAWNRWSGLDAGFNHWSAIAPMLATSLLIIACGFFADALAAALQGVRREALRP